MNMEPKQPKEATAEILPLKELARGDIGTISEELERVRYNAEVQNENILNVNEYSINPLLEAQKEGYKYILRLPRVNEKSCVEKHGAYYDKTKAYDEFVETLARRNNVTPLKHLHDNYYLFVEKNGAEILKAALTEQQLKAKLEFETVDNNAKNIT